MNEFVMDTTIIALEHDGKKDDGGRGQRKCGARSYIFELAPYFLRGGGGGGSKESSSRFEIIRWSRIMQRRPPTPIMFAAAA